ncbi:cytochrome P450 [Catellatospora citrea]|uniref:Cytochrome P450 n=1 Tax=Catellatospora citrea TaxID=53366 RepID=A0A8J3K5K1_9ACTN|nr:cytochrome P450 [Catellatospora citrea]RKE05524.1 cholest-4-en-3-one 26-monooxygenase [Catellatospora citrea]GIF96872.1 cytochrome P450 [Catellatospora citrea]
MKSAVIDLTDVDLFVRGEHHATFAYLRAHDPVHWNASADGTGFWALTRYDDVLAAYRDHGALSSESGAVLGGSFRSQKDTAAGRMLVATDPPRHRMLRQLLHPAWGPQMLNRVREQVTQLVDRALTRLSADGGGDFAQDVSTQLPAGALMAMMGLGQGDADELVRLTRRMIGYRDPAYAGDIEADRLRLAYYQSEIFEFFSDLCRQRRRQPGDDLVSILLRAELNGRPLTEADILYNCMNVAVGGNETTSYTASSGMIALIEHPGEYERLLTLPDISATAIEEFLRWGSTNAYVQRVATRDLRIGTADIAAGDSVVLWNVSANRDESHFPAADRFDLTRSPNRHLSFGSGIHRCAGSAVANIELTVLLDAIVERRLRLRLAGPVEPLHSNFILGTNRFPVSVA